MYKRCLILFAISAIALSSCEKNDTSLDQSELEGGESAVITVQDIELPPLGNHSMVLSFYSEEPWSIDKPEWIKVTPSNGRRGNTKITVSATVGAQSDYTDNLREAVVRFVSNSGVQLQSFKVKQQRPYLHIVPVSNQTRSAAPVKAAPEPGFDYVFEWDEYGTLRDSWNLAVESNIDWTIPAHNEHYEVVVEPGQKSDTDRFLRRSTIRIRPFKMNNSNVPENCDVQILPDAVKSGEIDAERVECPQDIWKFKHKNLTFLINGKPLSDIDFAFNMGQLTADFASYDKDAEGQIQAIREFEITIDATQGVKFSDVKITPPSWMEQNVVVKPDPVNQNKASFQLRVKSVYYDETQTNKSSRTEKVNVKFHAPNAGGESLNPENDFEVTQEPFDFGIKQDEVLSLADISFANENWKVSSISVNTKANWDLTLKDPSKGGWIEGDIFNKEYGYAGSVDIAPSAQNMSFTTDKSNPNTAVLRITSKVDHTIFKEINISQKQFIFELSDDWAKDTEKKLDNMYSGDLNDHPVTLKISGEWEAHVYDVEKGTVTNAECDWLKLSKTSGDGSNSGEQFTITPQTCNISEDMNREARLVITSLRHKSDQYSDKTRFLNAVQKKIYFNIILKEVIDGKEYDYEEGASLKVPAYKKNLNTYRVYLDCSREVVKNVEYFTKPDFLTYEDPSALLKYNKLAFRPRDAEIKYMDYLYLNNRKDKSPTAQQPLTVRFTIDKGSGTGIIEKKFYFQQDGYVNTMQDKGDYAEIHPYSVPASGLAYTFQMTKEAPWSAVVIGDAADWITLKQSSGIGTGQDDELVFTVAKNPTSESRTGQISIRDDFAPENNKTITINQAPYVFSAELVDKNGNPVDEMQFRELGSSINTDEVYTVKVTSSGPFVVKSASASGSETQNMWVGASTLKVPSTDNSGYPIVFASIINESLTEGGKTLFPEIYPIVLDEVKGISTLQNVISPKSYQAHQDAYKWDVVLLNGSSSVSKAAFGVLAGKDEEQYTVKVKSSGPWTMSKPDWVIGSTFEGSGNQDGTYQEFRFGATNNRTESPKSDNLVALSTPVKSLNKSFAVTQNPFVIKLEKVSESRTEPMDETPMTISLSGTTNNFSIIPGRPELFNSISYDKALGLITYSPKKNVKTKVQEDVIRIVNEDCDAEKTIKYSQAEYVFKVDESQISTALDELSPKMAQIAVTVPKNAGFDFSNIVDNENIIAELNKSLTGVISVKLKNNIEKHEKSAQFKIYSIDNPELNKVVTVKQKAYRFEIGQLSLSCPACPTSQMSNSIVCSGGWSASSTEEWLDVIDKDSKSASKPNSISFKASNNPSESARSAKVVVVSKENPEIFEVFSVNQNGHAINVELLGDFGPYDPKERTNISKVTGDGSFQVRLLNADDAEWITASLANGQLIVEVGINTEKTPRESDIEVYCPDTTPNLSKTVHISQTGFVFDDSEGSISVSADGGPASFEEIICSGTWTASTDATWITIKSASSSNKSILEISADSYDNKETDRYAEVVVTCDQNSAFKKVIKVVQHKNSVE